MTKLYNKLKKYTAFWFVVLSVLFIGLGLFLVTWPLIFLGVLGLIIAAFFILILAAIITERFND